MIPTTTFSRRTALALGLGLVAAACSSDSKDGGDTSAAPTTSASTTSSTAKSTTTSSTETTDATDTTASGSDTTVVTDSTEVVTTETVPAVPTYPLTGLPILDATAAQRPAMVVKIDNHPDARPQRGLNEADIIFEENVEQLTRFAAVFHSNGVNAVGPIRSGRTQDVDLLGSLNRPIFIWSGGNGRVTAAINDSDLVAVNQTRAGSAMFRNKDRGFGATKAPHNLFGKMPEFYANFTEPDAGPPPPQFQYLADGQTPTGEGADGVKVSMDGLRARWQWDAGAGSYLRFTDEKPHDDGETGQQVSVKNVVVLYVDYVPSPADARSPEAQTEGFGVAWVFTGGTFVQGKWIRTDRTQPFALTDAEDAPILLTPGNTFVELARSAKGTPIAPGQDPNEVGYP